MLLKVIEHALHYCGKIDPANTFAMSDQKCCEIIDNNTPMEPNVVIRDTNDNMCPQYVTELELECAHVDIMHNAFEIDAVFYDECDKRKTALDVVRQEPEKEDLEPMHDQQMRRQI